MDLITIFLLAIALSFDSFAVSISCGLGCCQWCWAKGIRFAVVLGFMQGLMTFVGWALAINIHDHISQWDHWIAFSLLLILGAKMIYGGVKKDDKEAKPTNPLKFGQSILLGIATSIDAVIAGVSLAFVSIAILNACPLANISLSSFIIMFVTFCASIIGLLLGRSCRGGLGGKLGNSSEIIGGVVLILIGVKVLCEHLM